MLTRKFLFFFLGLFFTFSSQALAQNSPQIRRLPPSLERELKLRKGGKVRIIGFVDTLKAQSLIAQSIRDSSSEELDSMSVRDTAIIMIDSSVSLTDKEWLDSMLAELPEYRMTPQGIRFQYPAEILVETTRKVVPPDTTLTSKMDPVFKEDLPFYDAMPMPRPLEQLHLPRTSLELGAGTPYLPRIDLHSLIISNQQTALEIFGKYRLTTADDPAIKQFLILGLKGEFAFPNSDLPVTEAAPQLDIDASSSTTKRRIISQIETADYTLYRTTIAGNFMIGTPSQLRLQVNAAFSLLNNDPIPSIGDAPYEITNKESLTLAKDIGSSSYRLSLDILHHQAGTILGIGATTSPELWQSKLLVEHLDTERSGGMRDSCIFMETTLGEQLLLFLLKLV